ncbi:MAG: ATP-dependent Clp protease ATP-binding subunit [Planctomycetes bacterium]|nr:ATP-dependent Clp protease ATP-binding subunit [Planctomycetota bacterium]
MPQHEYRLAALVTPLENGLFFGESLFFPEVSRLGGSALRVRRALAVNAADLAARVPAAFMHRRAVPDELVVRTLSLDVPPPRDTPLWKEPLRLQIPWLAYNAPGHCVAFVPSLAMEVIAPNEAELLGRLPAETLAALRRREWAASLSALACHLRGDELILDVSPLAIRVPTPRESARETDQGKPERSVLAEVADDLIKATLPEAWNVNAQVARLADLLGGRTPQSVLLVGPPGVGKTAMLHELVRQRTLHGLGDTPFFATSGSRLVAGMSGFGMWQERCDRLRLEAARRAAILHLGQLSELMEVGKGMMIQQGVAGFLRPYIARGELRVVVECTPSQLPFIERQDPHLLGSFARLDVTEPTAADGADILRRAAAGAANEPALDTVARLHRRYATYSAWPGRPLRFLRNLIADKAGSQSTPADVYAAFSQETGMPLDILDDSRPLPLDQVQAFFDQRIAGQKNAISLVIDLLATVKSGLARPHRPLASFLFVGPTGVGKTETAKALAEFLFSDRRRVVRFDMTEFASPGAVQRLIGGAHGEGLLTAKVREQPFSVLLFDEFEKADPSFFDLMLQVLGEARLTDARGRLADFGNTVVIMTSNLGAETFLRGRVGFGTGGLQPEDHFTGALQRFARPELTNRIDRVVPFLPLPPEAVARVLDKELELIRRRPGIRASGASLDASPEARAALVAAGWQPELGARPLKREIERQLLVPIAEALNTGASAGTEFCFTARHGKIALEQRTGGQSAHVADAPAMAVLAAECATLRRKSQSAQRAPAIQEVRNEAYRIRRALEFAEQAARKRGKAWIPVSAERDRKRLPQLESIVRNFDEVLARASALEDSMVLAACGRELAVEDALRAGMDELRILWRDALLDLMRLKVPTADLATLALAGGNHDHVFELGRGYAGWAHTRGFDPRVVWHSQSPTDADIADMRRRAENDAECRAAVDAWQAKGNRGLLAIFAANPMKFLVEPREEPGTLALQFSGRDIALHLAPEAGRHVFSTGHDQPASEVLVSVHPGAAMKPDTANSGDAPRNLRRGYNLSARLARDELLQETIAWTGSRLDTVVQRGLEGTFERLLERQVDS